MYFYINFNNTKIKASKGVFDINLSLLKIDNSIFNRYIYNSEGEEEYQLNIKSDYAKWFKKDNTLLFTSDDKQVETTINLLLIK